MQKAKVLPSARSQEGKSKCPVVREGDFLPFPAAGTLLFVDIVCIIVLSLIAERSQLCKSNNNWRQSTLRSL
jgi:hypothetical protein